MRVTDLNSPGRYPTRTEVPWRSRRHPELGQNTLGAFGVPTLTLLAIPLRDGRKALSLSDPGHCAFEAQHRRIEPAQAPLDAFGG